MQLMPDSSPDRLALVCLCGCPFLVQRPLAVDSWSVACPGCGERHQIEGAPLDRDWLPLTAAMAGALA